MQTLKEKLMKAKKRIAELEYTEDWKLLVDGIVYRKVGTQVEINIVKTFDEAQWVDKWASLPLGYLPERLSSFNNYLSCSYSQIN